MTTNELHKDIHDILADIRWELKQLNHQEIHYGELPSMLHLHMLCHALNRETNVYVEIDGREYLVTHTKRRVDKLGRQDTAITLMVNDG